MLIFFSGSLFLMKKSAGFEDISFFSEKTEDLLNFRGNNAAPG